MSSLVIQNCSFYELNYLFSEDRNVPGPSYRLKNDYVHFVKASAIYLQKLNYPVTIQNTSFSHNRL